MTRIEKALELWKPTFRDIVIANHCPKDIDKTLPEYDCDTYRFSFINACPGCRGITCEECWDKEIEEVK